MNTIGIIIHFYLILLVVNAILVPNDNNTQKTDPYANPNLNEFHNIAPIRNNLYRFTVDQGRAAHSSLFLVTEKGIILIDPIRTSAALWLKEELKQRYNQTVKYVIYSHAHFDHIGGSHIFQKDGAIVISHENALEPIIGERLPVAIPNTTFKDNMTIHLGDEIVNLYYLGPSHSDSLIIIEIPRHRTIMAVDICPVGALPFNDFLDFYYNGWIKSLEWLNRRDFDILESGHYDLGNKTEVAINLEYMKMLHSQVLELSREGQSWDQLWRNVQFDNKFKNRIGFDDMRILNILGMYRWVSNHRRGVW